jgi:hypothetical protein
MIYTTQVTDRESLKKYILAKLGGALNPEDEAAHNIELSAYQLEIVIDRVMLEFLENAYSGFEKKYIMIQVNPSTFTGRVELAGDVLAVCKIMGGSNYQSIFQQAVLGSISTGLFVNSSLLNYSYLDYDIAQFNLNQINERFSTAFNFAYNSKTKMLKVFDVGRMKTNTSFLIETYSIIGDNETEFENIYSHPLILDWCEALAYIQWYQNLIKYKGSVFDGNLEINVEAIGQLGKEKLENVKKDLVEKYTDCFGSVYTAS